MKVKPGHHTCIVFKNIHNLNIGDECVVKINDNIFGKSYVEEKLEEDNLIVVNLPDDAEEYLENYLKQYKTTENLKTELYNDIF